MDDGLVQRMGNGADQPGCGAARQLGVGVKREHVADLAEQVNAARLDGEGVKVAGQQLIQVDKLSPLALPAHPDSFAHVEDAVTMKKNESARVLAGVFLVQLLDQVNGQLDQRIRVSGAGFAYRIRQVGEQSEIRRGSPVARERTSKPVAR